MSAPRTGNIVSTPNTRSGVVVGTDGSSSAQRAITWAARDAALRNVELTIVYAITPRLATSLVTPVPIGVVDRARQAGREILHGAAQLAKDSSDGSLRITTAMPSASAVSALVAAATRAELVVVGGSGTSAISRMLLGSVTAGVLHHARCPVAVIPDEYSPADTAGAAPVLVGVDALESSDGAMEVAFEEAALRGVELVVLHAWWAPGAYELPGFEWDELRPDVETWLSDRLRGCAERHPDVVVRRAAVPDQPARHLSDHPGHPQLIVVGSHGHGEFAGKLLGSVSNAVVQSARVPVIVARRQ